MRHGLAIPALTPPSPPSRPSRSPPPTPLPQQLAKVAVLRGSAAAAGIALINSVGNLGGFLGPYMIGEVKDRTGDYGMGIVAVGAFVALSGVLTLLLARFSPETGKALRQAALAGSAPLH